jgi:hypothetical protein
MKRRIKLIMVAVICLFTVSIPTQQANAGIIEIIRQAVVKAIKAADLAIQRQQNRVVWLQNAQKVLENTLAKLKLKEISEWTEKQRDQYQKYFEELRKVKMLIAYYQRIRDISQKQIKLVDEYSRVWQIIRSDEYFNESELNYMEKVYSGILSETVKNIDGLALIVNSFKTQMGDAKRLEIINQISERVDSNFADLKAFNTENGMLRIQRAKSKAEIESIKKLYGIQ